ncbi:hypothetical protein M0R45_001914 [Rubus argutus]|uniref:ADP-ribosyl cyclase/cyclic ADP-ribose hydrolase n=1 Tax=Rubus argutus TaxID=59490 RepID=A0AAW1VKE2_RUBAR
MALSTQRASTSLPSTESPPRWKHDVFLSFWGADTCKDFVSHLYRKLQYWQTIKTFKDDQELEVGASISPELLNEIEASHLAIVVLSPNYASSAWCLDELAKVFESMETRDNTILPIFFQVDPCDVWYQTGSFAQAFVKHEERFRDDREKLKRWRAALRKVANLSGWDSKDYECERELINVIVKCVWSKVHPTITLSDSKDKLVGINSRLVELDFLLALEANDVRFIGIWGMGGMGKTTLAKVVFERISHHFEVSKFLVNVREVSAKHGTLVHLQKQLLSPILKENIAQVWDEQEGILFIRKCLSNKKVLLIVDNIDHYNQLEILVGNKSWFGEGSRVIITTRDERLLNKHDIETFKIEGLNASTALELFSDNAFRKDEPHEGFLELSKRFVDYAKGLPLALKILGRSLYKRGRDEWISALDNLNNSPDTKIFSSLKISYDGLSDMSQNIFLDVAFFYKGKEKNKLIEILDRTYDFSSLSGINVLIEKSLLIIERGNKVEMHDLIQKMAWEIVRRESRDEPGFRSRLYHRNDIFHIFLRNTGTEAIKGIRLYLPELEEADLSWNLESFSKMLKLTVLEFHNLMIHSAPKFLPNSLRILNWSLYPSKFLPASYRPNLLVELHMRNSKLVQLWDGKLDLPNMKCMVLSFSKNLTKIPDVSGIPNLEVLELPNCTELVEIHPSFAVLKKLTRLQLTGCKSIKSFPSELEMDSLRLLGLGGCSKLRSIPEFGIHMKNLTSLDLSGTLIEKIPSSMERLVGLENLVMNRCSKLEELPEFLRKMECLKQLSISETAIREPPPFLFQMGNLELLHFDGKSTMTGKLDVGFWGLFGSKSPQPLGFVLPTLRDLRSVVSLNLVDHNLCEGAIPDDIGYCMTSLRFVDLSGNNFVTLPASIKFLSMLETFNVERCPRLQQLPDLPSNHMLDVIADDCAALKLLSEPLILLSSPSTKSAEFTFSSVNCYGLVDEEGRNNEILSMIRRLAAEGIPPIFQRFNIVSPGSQIPWWFSNQSEGDSLIVQLPPESCSRWMGIAFCVVTADLGNPVAIGCEFLSMKCFWNGNCCNFSGFKVSGHFVRAHLWIFYMTREDIRHTFSYYNHNKIWLTNTTNKCGARLVCEQDLEELLHTTVKSLKRTHDYSDYEEGPSGSGSSNKESLFKRLKGRLFS